MSLKTGSTVFPKFTFNVELSTSAQNQIIPKSTIFDYVNLFIRNLLQNEFLLFGISVLNIVYVHNGRIYFGDV